MGCFETNTELIGRELISSQINVEENIADRTLLTWRIPEGGESVVDLRTRITEEFLPQLVSQAAALNLERPRILVASHGLFIKELHRILRQKSIAGDNFGMEKPVVNTSVSQYSLQVESGGEIRDVRCEVFACDKHLQ